jgi:hypothetical protein
MSQSNANTWIRLLHKVLNRALAPQALVPARTDDDLAVWLAAERTNGVPMSAVLARWYGATNPRPTDPKEQQECYNDKQKCHTVKNLLVIDAIGPLCFLSAIDEAKAKDISLAALEG